METENYIEGYKTVSQEDLYISEDLSDHIMFTILDLEDENIRLDDKKCSNSEMIDKIRTIIEDSIRGATNDS